MLWILRSQRFLGLGTKGCGTGTPLTRDHRHGQVGYEAWEEAGRRCGDAVPETYALPRGLETGAVRLRRVLGFVIGVAAA